MPLQEFLAGPYTPITFCAALERGAGFKVPDWDQLGYALRCGCEHCSRMGYTIGPERRFWILTDQQSIFLIKAECDVPAGLRQIAGPDLDFVRKCLLKMFPDGLIVPTDFTPEPAEPTEATGRVQVAIA